MNTSHLQEPAANFTDRNEWRKQQDAEKQAAADLMARQVREEHRRWGQKLVLWKDGRIVYEDP